MNGCIEPRDREEVNRLCTELTDLRVALQALTLYGEGIESKIQRLEARLEELGA